MEKIRELRLLKKMTQEQLAEAVDISVGYISALENGKKSPMYWGSPRRRFLTKRQSRQHSVPL